MKSSLKEREVIIGTGNNNNNKKKGGTVTIDLTAVWHLKTINFTYRGGGKNNNKNLLIKNTNNNITIPNNNKITNKIIKTI